MPEKINQRYSIDNSSALVSILKKMKEYDITYKVEFSKKCFHIRCYNMDLGQQDIISSFGKIVKKINWD